MGFDQNGDWAAAGDAHSKEVSISVWVLTGQSSVPLLFRLLKRGIHIGMGFDIDSLVSRMRSLLLKRGIHIGMGFDVIKPQSLIWDCGFIKYESLFAYCYGKRVISPLLISESKIVAPSPQKNTRNKTITIKKSYYPLL
ncbi:protein of unknown function [Maridesulfovibrio hydrothermalis AM13 = DSM 14728]|uniref:Uncharacterized protein n=2 Tax=Maridesulfovibrio TaxID=2794998 RepID=L0R5R9_9BACT|nr:protein of unknown function [Maridesulfovibrio hydrothermalis AM13 = DSM 14728]